MSVIARQLSDADIDNLAAWYSGIQISVTVPE
jgi:cytochrome c553